MRRAFLPIIVALSLFAITWIRTDGFFPSIIEESLNAQGLPASSEIIDLLSQPFDYLGKGRQCFVFRSRDEKYVLKFFNQKYFQMPWYSFFVGEKESKKRTLRRHFYENSYEIALKEFGDEVLFYHKGISEDLPAVLIRDRAGRIFKIDLNQVSFVLQKKGEPFYEALNAIYQKEGREGLYREIDAFIAAISKRISKQIADADSDIEHNWGYVDGHLFHLDPGRLYYDPCLQDPERQRQEWQTATRHFVEWLQNHYPEAAEYFRNQSRLQNSKDGEKSKILSPIAKERLRLLDFRHEAKREATVL